jgi:uncharacterized protein (TIGR00375 family)
MATSPAMLPGAILKACRLKGIAVIGTGDALHPRWREAWEQSGCMDCSDVLVVPTLEVQGRRRVHHLALMENFGDCEDLARMLAPHSPNIETNGRPNVALDGRDIAAMVHQCGGLVGPAHAFTPWTGMYANFDSVSSCYGDEPIDLLELGLSADSSYAAQISELAGVTFLSNSDAHSPSPAKIGREFNRLQLTDWSAKGALNAVRHGEIMMNAGFFPEEGKYNRTACSRCFTQYSLQEARIAGWRCVKDQGIIKKGVMDRARELWNGTSGQRPPYLHIIPLIEIIQRTLGHSSPASKGCLKIYHEFIRNVGPEITVLCDASFTSLAGVNPAVADAVRCFREGRIRLFPGGGGKYGSFSCEDVPVVQSGEQG